MGLFDLFKKKETDAQQEVPKEHERLENFAEMLSCKLLFIDKPKRDSESILNEVKKYFSDVVYSDEKSISIYTFPNIKIELADATIPAQCIVAVADEDKSHVELPEVAFQQNWHWQEAKDVAGQCKYEVLVTDLMTRSLAYKERVNVYMNFLVAVCKAMKPDAVYVTASQKLVKPSELIAMWEGEEKQILYTLCNVRLYNISNSATKELLMDSVGLHSIGLPDLEIRFAGFDESAIAALLWNYVYYVYEHGDVIENGNTLEGLDKGSKWKCERLESLVAPERIVINVIPN